MRFDSRLRTLVCAFPTRDLLLHPRCAFVSMALETRVGALGLPEALRHLGIRNVVDLMRTRAEQKCVHDGRHVTGDALARLRAAGMV